ncbi:hypothetical protein [Bartonella doshiae]|uniref:Uncharacterized protein n=2 Tax=Bartonella doshiae TaxID=33044 RepID=A0A380ZFI3_BARDO|nr:hypothetical protein [Bartonella doshiae]EJF81200.1 hypothetical protein MCS_00913 [Bartonella doshiae NCTC 12862 = ATCC 700133]MBB6159835.1 hypothetical protein [Bartonella doshiae]SUV45351.1 Uncharacterised protein [Bartonella doshiae]
MKNRLFHLSTENLSLDEVANISLFSRIESNQSIFVIAEVVVITDFDFNSASCAKMNLFKVSRDDILAWMNDNVYFAPVVFKK